MKDIKNLSDKELLALRKQEKSMKKIVSKEKRNKKLFQEHLNTIDEICIALRELTITKNKLREGRI